MADYWSHWLEIGERAGAKLPKIYYVNWFRKSEGGDFLWPGFGDNGRVLKWIFERCEGTAKAIESPIGNIPIEGALDIDGLDEVSRDDLEELLQVDVDGWLEELPLISEYYDQFGAALPAALRDELAGMKQRLEAAKG
jgi:phosphoenolpyruvate carboxykinase (GTP)